MHKIDWNAFKSINENCTKSFEDLCYHLFCRTHKFPQGIPADFNQVGLETYPQKSKSNGKTVGFQAKFFENGTDYDQIEKSITKALNVFGKELDEITIYINSNAVLSSKKAKEIISLAKSKDVKINWFSNNRFQIAVNQPKHLDLAQLYFGIGDEHGFVKSNISIEDSNFFQFGDFIDLPILELPSKKTVKINLTQKVTVLTGNPGSGKTILVKNLFCTFAKIFKTRTDFNKNLILPMLVNLKDCYFDSLENLIRQRQKDYQLINKKIKFIYILDGLDELNVPDCDLSLRYVKKLAELSTTENIIISCRKGSLNKLKVSELFKTYQKLEIDQLSVRYINKYFKQKNDQAKIKKLSSIKLENESLLKDITDVFLVKLFWDTIDELSKHSTIIDLIELKIKKLLKEPNHRSNLHDLNLLNPKEDSILNLNELLSYRYSKKYQYRFKHSSISKFLCKKFPQLNYDDINKIASYNINTFFDSTIDEENHNNTYIYQHRRYQEYFFARRLKKKFEKDIKVIRSSAIILNSDFFDDIFMKYLENEYRRAKDIASMTLLNSIKFYQGRDPFYVQDSTYFIECLASQKNNVLEILLNDDILNTRKYITGTFQNALVFYEKGKENIADELISKCTGDFWKFENVSHLKELEGYLLNKLRKDEDTNNIYYYYFLQSYRKFYKTLYSDSNTILENQSPREYAIKCYFSIGLKHFIDDLIQLIPNLNEVELCFFLDLLSKIEFLPFFFNKALLQDAVAERVKKFRKSPKISNLSIFFFRRILKLNISENQIKKVVTIIQPLKPRVRQFSFGRHIHIFAISYVIVGENRLRGQTESIYDFPSVDDVLKYCVLFSSYCNTFENKDSFSKTLVNYRDRFKKWHDSLGNVKEELSKLWAYIFYYAKGNKINFLQLSQKLTFDLQPLVFLRHLNNIDGINFPNIVSETELVMFEQKLENQKEDYSVYVDNCFIVGNMYSHINAAKSLQLIRSAFINSKIRHGWRKDVFISDFLNDSFDQILQKNWLTKEKILELSDTIFSLNIRLYEITDQDHTRYGVFEFIKAISQYSTKLAYKYLNKFEKLDLESHIYRISLIAIIIEDIKRNAITYDEIEQKIKIWKFSDKAYSQALFDIEMEVLQSDFYDDDIKAISFTKAHKIVSTVKGKFDYQKGLTTDCYNVYDLHCKLHKKNNEIIFDNETDNIEQKIPQINFSEMLENVSSNEELTEIYSLIDNTFIDDKQIWKKLITVTFLIEGDINLFITLLEKKYFLSSGFWGGENEGNLHLGVACSLENPNTSEQMETYLMDTSGYASFNKLIHVYIAMEDKKMALNFFYKFVRFCDFLVN